MTMYKCDQCAEVWSKGPTRDAILEGWTCPVCLTAKLQAAELEVTRACDHVGCTAAIIRRDDGTRVCAAGHPSRWVERSEFDASQAEVARLTEAAIIAREYIERTEDAEVVESLRTRIAELETGLRELYATVRGECPSLLNEDSGGNAGLDMRLAALLGEEK